MEEKIELADVQTLKGAICEAEDTDLIISLKGLSIHARRKLFSVISDYKADEYASHCEYMGVRQIDVMAFMSEQIACICAAPHRTLKEKQEGVKELKSEHDGIGIRRMELGLSI